MARKIRMGMVGGGRGAFIGGVHRIAAAMDGEIELVCGAFSSSPEKSIASGQDLMLDPDRCYADFKEMIKKEKKRKDRMDVVSIVTPNHMHFEPAKLALENGYHVICDKPVTFTLQEAKKLKDIIQKTGLTFALTHNYTGYPMVKEARQLIRNGALGKIRKVVVEYPQGWLSFPIEKQGSKQAEWRVDPSKSGVAGAVGDLGTHAENLAEFVTGLRITELCADLSSVVEGRVLDDDANILLHFDNGAKGILHCSQICNGDLNGLNIRVYGELGSLHWRQETPQYLHHKSIDGHKIYQPNVGKLSDEANANTRIPFGHPEGYLEAFANIYRNFARTVRKRMNGEEPTALDLDFPTIDDGIRGMQFIETVIASGKQCKWTKFKS
ncbi:Gfo/Idh/MocA family oxidoreductase [Flavihumibacter rivuli]|uniref:Gfo/Idh/MocA family protein n=1 Tax=Flavihumibacter rivuli TaxID=2838156 RepID=UPI001BDEDAB0|nr:Gfo/Idh/MocA family oxidoreductase [Flavihumibacter rivuli]ULQ57776.1 Gfo/Idh/MocA family oxidoreductase [Flavihumibacter rivuli]